MGEEDEGMVSGGRRKSRADVWCVWCSWRKAPRKKYLNIVWIIINYIEKTEALEKEEVEKEKLVLDQALKEYNQEVAAKRQAIEIRNKGHQNTLLG